VPLGWLAETSMIKDANPQEISKIPYIPGKQTVEFRAPDGSADIYHLLAGLVVAAQYGLQADDSLRRAEELYVDVNIFKEEHKDKLESLEHLPQSCFQSAELLDKYRAYFEKNNIFPQGTIDRFVAMLKAYHDFDLSERLYGKNDEIKRLVEQYMHCM